MLTRSLLTPYSWSCFSPLWRNGFFFNHPKSDLSKPRFQLCHIPVQKTCNIFLLPIELSPTSAFKALQEWCKPLSLVLFLPHPMLQAKGLCGWNVLSCFSSFCCVCTFPPHTHLWKSLSISGFQSYLLHKPFPDTPNYTISPSLRPSLVQEISCMYYGYPDLWLSLHFPLGYKLLEGKDWDTFIFVSVNVLGQ